MNKNLPACPIETTLLLISNKWSVLIIHNLMNGTMRFGELKNSMGNISQKVLTSQLRSLEENGILTREIFAEIPPRVEYTLTDTGYSLESVLISMAEWGKDYQLKNGY